MDMRYHGQAVSDLAGPCNMYRVWREKIALSVVEARWASAQVVAASCP
jgi:hypothetical protein